MRRRPESSASYSDQHQQPFGNIFVLQGTSAATIAAALVSLQLPLPASVSRGAGNTPERDCLPQCHGHRYHQHHITTVTFSSSFPPHQHANLIRTTSLPPRRHRRRHPGCLRSHIGSSQPAVLRRRPIGAPLKHSRSGTETTPARESAVQWLHNALQRRRCSARRPQNDLHP